MGNNEKKVQITISERTSKLLDEFCKLTRLDREFAADTLLWQKLVDHTLDMTVSTEEADLLKPLIIPQPPEEEKT